MPEESSGSALQGSYTDKLGKCQVEEAKQIHLVWLDDLQKGFPSSQRSKLECILNILVSEIRQ